MNKNCYECMAEHTIESYGSDFCDDCRKWIFAKMHPEDDTAKERKATPIFSGVLKYFPDAMREVARCSAIGNEQHNPGTGLHWDRAKSGDELDALTRHLLDAGTRDSDGTRHSAKVAWRALANLQKEIEAEAGQ